MITLKNPVKLCYMIIYVPIIVKVDYGIVRLYKAIIML